MPDITPRETTTTNIGAVLSIKPDSKVLTLENPKSTQPKSAPATESTRFKFNPGHTQDILKVLPGLLDTRNELMLISKGANGTEVMDIPIEVITDYLEKHYADNPHAIAEVFRLVGEELKQIDAVPSIISGIEYGISNPDAKDMIDSGKEQLIFWLTSNPQQMKAAGSFLKNSTLKQITKRYIEDFGKDHRVDLENRQTADTNEENMKNMKKVIAKQIKNRMDGLSILSKTETQEILAKADLPISLPPEFEELTKMAKQLAEEFLT